MSTYEVSVGGRFTASHALPLAGGGREETHKHEWRVTATFRSSSLSGETGVVVDFVKVQASLNAVTDQLDGRDLNSLPVLADGPPSAERVAEYLAERLATDRLYRVSVTEAPGCSAAYYPHGP